MRCPVVRKCCCLYTMYHINNVFSCVLKVMRLHQLASQGQCWIEYLYLLLATPPYYQYGRCYNFVVITNKGGCALTGTADIDQQCATCFLSASGDWLQITWRGPYWWLHEMIQREQEVRHLVLRTYLWVQWLSVMMVSDFSRLTAVSISLLATAEGNIQ